MTGNMIQEHVKKYVRVGTEHIFLLTNLPDTHAQKLETALQTSIKNQNIKVKTLKVISRKDRCTFYSS